MSDFIPAPGDVFFAHSKRLGRVIEERDLPGMDGAITRAKHITHNTDEVYDKMILICEVVGENFLVSKLLWADLSAFANGRKFLMTIKEHTFKPVEPEIIHALGIKVESEKQAILDSTKKLLSKIQNN